VEPVEADCADAAAREIEQGRAPHRAQPDDGYIKLLAHVVKRRAFSSRKRCSARMTLAGTPSSRTAAT